MTDRTKRRVRRRNYSHASQELKDLKKGKKEEIEDLEIYGATLASAFNINGFLRYFIDHRPDDVQEMVEQKMSEMNFPKEAKWDSVIWELKGRNKLDFVEWVLIGKELNHIKKEDFLDDLKYFVRSNRDYEMYAKEHHRLLNISVDMLETAEQWKERQGNVIKLAKMLENQFDSNLLGELLKQPEYLEKSYNPTVDLFRERAEGIGLPQQATVLNTKYQIIPKPTNSFEEIADTISMIYKGDNSRIDELMMERNKRQINELFTSQFVLPHFAIEVKLLDSLESWEERNQAMVSPNKASKILAKALEKQFDPLLFGEEFSTLELLQYERNACYFAVVEKLDEEQFPKEANPYNVDFDAKAKVTTEWKVIAEKIIDLSGYDYEAINNLVHADGHLLLKLFKTAELVVYLDFDITLNQTAEEWLEDNPDISSEAEMYDEI